MKGRTPRWRWVACAAGQLKAVQALLPAASGERVVQVMDFLVILNKSKSCEDGSFRVNALEAAALCANAPAVEMLAKSGKFAQSTIDEALMLACLTSLPLDKRARREKKALDSFESADQGALALLPFVSEAGARQAASALSDRGVVITAIAGLLGESREAPGAQVALRLQTRRAERERLKNNPAQKPAHPLGDWS